MSLIQFHRFLIAAAILFCGGFAVWEFDHALREGGAATFVIGTVFVLLAAALAFYLKELSRFLGYDRHAPSDS